MKYTWDLDCIYRGFDDPAFAADLAELEKAVAQMTMLAEALPNMEAELALCQFVDVDRKSVV